MESLNTKWIDWETSVSVPENSCVAASSVWAFPFGTKKIALFEVHDYQPHIISQEEVAYVT